MRKLLALSVLTLSTSAFAEDSSTYFGLSYLKADATISDSYFDDDKNADLTAWFATVGHSFNKYFALEARVGKGRSSGSVDSSGWMLPADLELERFSGVYGKLSWPVSDRVSPYAVVGFTRGEMSIEFSDGFSASDSESGRSLGIGVNFLVGESSAINIENTTYIDKGGTEVSGLSFGYQYRF